MWVSLIRQPCNNQVPVVVETDNATSTITWQRQNSASTTAPLTWRRLFRSGRTQQSGTFGRTEQSANCLQFVSDARILAMHVHQKTAPPAGRNHLNFRFGKSHASIERWLLRQRTGCWCRQIDSFWFRLGLGKLTSAQSGFAGRWWWRVLA